MDVQKIAILIIDAEYLVVYWQSKGHNAIYEKRVTQFHENVPTYLSVTNWLRCLYTGEDLLHPGIHMNKPSDGLIDFKILTVVVAFPLHGMRTLAGALKIPLPTK